MRYHVPLLQFSLFLIYCNFPLLWSTRTEQHKPLLKQQGDRTQIQQVCTTISSSSVHNYSGDFQLDSTRSSRTALHESELGDFSNKPNAEEHVALTIASTERLDFPTNTPNTWKNAQMFLNMSNNST